MKNDLKKIGECIELKGIVIHQVSKVARETSCFVKKATEVINVTDKERTFIGRVNKVYYRKSSPTYGVFGDEEPEFKNELTKYLNHEINFFDFSVNAVQQYKKVISGIAPATGGLMIFAHFINTDKNYEYMLVLTINNKDGYVIDETNLTIADIKNLDLSKIDVACSINITKWNNMESGTDSVSKTYLSFVKGNKDVSHYFMRFIDCQDKTKNTESTKRLILALGKYCAKENYTLDRTREVKNKIFDYCSDCLKERKEISLDAISALFDNEQPQAFMEFAAEEENGVSAIISGDSKQLRRIRYVYYKDKNITIEFDANLLNKTVFYDKTKKQLTFKKLPEILIEELDK